jgi:hypothetical protein
MMKNTQFQPFVIVALFIASFLLLPTIRADKNPRERESVTFNKDVAPIMFKHCADCHRPGEAAPMPLLSFKDARPWAKSIREKVANHTMPPWHADPHYGDFKNDRRLSQKDLDTILAWVDGGAQEGNPADLPPAPKYIEGWSIGQPDAVFHIPEEFTLKASGPDEYRHFDVPTNFKEDRYVQAVEVRPGNRKIVHHVVVLITPPANTSKPVLSKEEAEKQRLRREKNSIVYKEGFLSRTKAKAPVHNDGCQLVNGGGGFEIDTTRRNDLDSALFVWAPGRDANIFELGTAKLIPAGSKIKFIVHYAKIAGSIQKDRSSVGLIFANKPPAKLYETMNIYNTYFQIPSGTERHRVTACVTTSEDIRINAFMPHMHLRGAAMEVRAFYQDGRNAILLNVPRYDFNWQTNYSLKQPLSVPKGTRLFITGTFDNSARNKFNPDPSQLVRFGEPTYDEMMVCFLDYTVDSKPVALTAGGQASPRQ